MRLRWLVEGNGFRDPKLKRLLCKDVNGITEASDFMVWNFFDQFSSCKQLSVFISEGLFFQDLLYLLLFPVLFFHEKVTFFYNAKKTLQKFG